MKTKNQLWLGFCLIFALSTGCGDNEKARQEEISMQKSVSEGFKEIPGFAGVFQDTLPCEDCKGILTRLDLKTNGTYKKSIIYLGKYPVLENSFATEGKWILDTTRQTIWLDSAIEKQKMGFFAEGDSLLISCMPSGQVLDASKNSLKRLSARVL
jgi:hypothetical protein